MAIKTYGKFKADHQSQKLIIEECEPHVSIKIKGLFKKIAVYQTPPYEFANTPENAADLMWLMQRYPLVISKKDLEYLTRANRVYNHLINEAERFLRPNYKPRPVRLNKGEEARHYQLQGKDLVSLVKRLLIADTFGLGKTLTSILCLLEPFSLPGIVAVQTHMTTQWKNQIERFTDLKVHIIKGTKPYNLPPADVYIIRYSCLSGWVNIIAEGRFKTAIYDEIQELRGADSAKHHAGRSLSAGVEKAIGLSATPIYNLGSEIFNILDLLKPGCLGRQVDFLREWCAPLGNGKSIVGDPQALGQYLRANNIMLRRTRSEVGRELPPINKIIIPVDYDTEEVKKAEDIAKMLAIKVTTGSFTQRGEAARQLDLLARRITGVSKAKHVAGYIKMLLESGERVVLAGWHREVYDIWLKELEDYKPVMYTGSETTRQKEEAFRKFNDKETNIFIISLRSGAGLDGLQHSCDLIAHGEFDWSPEVHNQLNGRVDRDRKEEQKQVTALYFASEYGSDPLIINLLGLKAAQSFGIMDPDAEPAEQLSDDGRLKKLAQFYLDKQ
jgi:SNF2 family DNA or RNA helicase